MISTEEAACKLGVSQRRVQELVGQGALEAKKVSGIWLIDEDSVQRRLGSVAKRGGRPRRGYGKNDVRFELMNRTHEVMPVIYHTVRKEFTFIGALNDPDRVPLGVAAENGTIALNSFNSWWRNRGIPGTRQNLAQLLADAGAEIPEDLLQRNLGLSLSDQYWIRPEGSGLKWEDINFFNNDFEQASAHIADFAIGGKDRAAKPDNTSDGNLDKHWICLHGVRTLVKGGLTYGQEPYNEVVATKLHELLLERGEFVPYSLLGSGATAQSACPCFIANDEEYVPAFYVEQVLPQSRNQNDFEHYLACCESLGISEKLTHASLDHMIVCDDILANHDRHHRNFGIIRNVETLECRPAPIFDSGSSLWCDIPTEQLAAGEHSFKCKQFYESPAKQMLLVDDLSWFDIKTLAGFADEACTILSKNDALQTRLPFIHAALEWRVNRMANIAEWA